MSGNQNKNSVTDSKRSTEKRKRQGSTSLSSISKKCKLARTSRIISKDGYLPLTQRWRELLFNEEDRNGPLARSEEIYRENVSQLLLNGLDNYARNPAKWSRHDIKVFYCNIIKLTVTRKKQLLKENTCDIINDRFNLILTSFYHELSAFMMFSDSKRRTIDRKVKELNDVRSQLAKSGQFLSSQFSLTTQLKNEPELSEVRKQSQECREEPTKTQDVLKEAHLKSNESSLGTELTKNTNHEQNDARLGTKNPRNSLKGKLKFHLILPVDRQANLDVCLQEKEKQLNELKKQLDSAAKKQKETEGELKKQLEAERELKKQLDSAAKKQKETEGELKKQLEAERELKKQLDSAAKKQKETEGERTRAIQLKVTVTL